MTNRTLAFIAAVAAASIAGCAEEPDTSPAVEPAVEQPAVEDAEIGAEASPEPAVGIPDTIVMERGGFIPEGVEYDQTNGRFLVGSLAEGTVFEIGTDGSMTPLIADEALVSSVGIEVDEPGDRLLVANSNSAVFQGQTPGQAMLGLYRLSTGERIAMIDLTDALEEVPEGAALFANDVAVGADGAAYVTDMRMNVVYRVGPDNVPSVLHRFDDMAQPNGIVSHDGGYLLVVGSGNLYKVPVDDPASTTQVTLPEPLEGGDGMVWTSDGRLAVVSNSQSRVIALASGDDWASAQLAGSAPFEGQGTTAAVVGEDVYVVKPHFADQDPPSIERVTFQ